MKSNIFFILSLTIVAKAFSQTPKSNIVNLSLPNQVFSLTRNQAASIIHTNFKRSSIPLNRDNYYQLGGLIISFWDVEENPGFETALTDTQSGIIGMLKRNQDTINFSKIIKINEMQFLVYEYQKDNEVHLWFQTEFHNNKHFGGVIEFKKPDEEKAQQVLQELLQSIHFKEQ
jgi:hypothetical protein